MEDARNDMENPLEQCHAPGVISSGKREGFAGQRIVVLPRQVVANALKQPLLQGLLPTDVGYFPKASHHMRERLSGVDQAIFIFCVKGQGWCELRGKRHEVHAGDMLVIPPGEPHRYGADEAKAWTIPWVHATGTHVPALLEQLGVSADTPTFFAGDEPQVRTLFEELLGTLERGYAPPYLLYAAQTLNHLIGRMIWRRRQTWRGAPDMKQRIALTIAYMKEHLEEPLRVSRLAALANLSASHYAALFREQTGYSPIDYLIRLRVHRACQWLDTTDLPVKEIALRVGYEDQLYFSRLFRQVNECSPSEYRALHKG
jgi:AraC family transcriptional regulator, arabinose operon regulatory protein